MAGINGFGNVNLGRVNQIGAAKGTQQTKLETESLLQKKDQLDGFVKSNDVKLEEAKKEDDKPKKEDGDGAKKGWKEKLSEFGRRYGEALERNNATFELDDFLTALGQAIGSYGWNEDPFQ